MGTIWQDIRYGLRMLLKSPSVSIVATIALALGIGANTAIFSVVNAVLLRPLPYPNSDALMSVFEKDQTRGVVNGLGIWWRKLGARGTGRGEPVRILGGVVTADLFSVLGANPFAGRGFLPDEDRPTETGRVVVLSERLFASRFNSDAGVLNHPITLDGKSYTVVGVMPHGFEFPIQNEPFDLWTTSADDAAGTSPISAQRGAHFLHVIGRLKPGVSETQAQAEVDTIAGRLEQQYPDTNTHKGIRVESALRALVGDVRPALLILLGAVACVLLIAATRKWPCDPRWARAAYASCGNC